MTTTQNEDDEFEILQAVEVDTRYLDSHPEQWEPATVYEIRRNDLSDRFIEVKYANGAVSAVLKSRVRPAPVAVETMVFADELQPGDVALFPEEALESGDREITVERVRTDAYGCIVAIGRDLSGRPTSFTRGAVVPVLVRRTP